MTSLQRKEKQVASSNSYEENQEAAKLLGKKMWNSHQHANDGSLKTKALEWAKFRFSPFSSLTELSLNPSAIYSFRGLMMFLSALH